MQNSILCQTVQKFFQKDPPPWRKSLLSEGPKKTGLKNLKSLYFLQTTSQVNKFLPICFIRGSSHCVIFSEFCNERKLEKSSFGQLTRDPTSPGLPYRLNFLFLNILSSR